MINRYMVQSAAAPVHLADHGLYVLYSDYVKDVNTRLEQAAIIAEQQEELADVVTYAPDKIRDLKVKL